MAVPGWKEGEMRRPEPVVLALLCLGLTGCCVHKGAPMLPPAGCTAPDSYVLNMDKYGQQAFYWCWAASGKMVMNHLGGKVEQCDEAGKRFDRSDCCQNPTGPCDQGGWPQPCKYGFRADRTSGTALTWDQVKTQIYCGQKPFAFTWKIAGKGAHMMVAYGYQTVGTNKKVEVWDPEPFLTFSTSVGTKDAYDYDDYVSGLNHTHWDDYYNFTKKK